MKKRTGKKMGTALGVLFLISAYLYLNTVLLSTSIKHNGNYGSYRNLNNNSLIDEYIKKK